MTVRSPSLLAAAVGLCLAHTLVAQEPAPLAVEPGPALAAEAAPSVNQHVADSIADRLRQSGRLQHYDVDVCFQDGTAELRGAVADQGQREEVLRLVQGVPGVERVVDRLTVSDGISQVQAAAPPALAETPATPVPAPTTTFAGQPAEPLPLSAGTPQPAPYGPPAYAAPSAHPPAAYPPGLGPNGGGFVGPAYPFPKIPLGWASVKLTWHDGYWWYGKTATKHDWWRFRYW
jgi:hypothetical protein